MNKKIIAGQGRKKGRRKCRKAIALLMSAAMTASCVAVPVFAETETGDDTPLAVDYDLEEDFSAQNEENEKLNMLNDEHIQDSLESAEEMKIAPLGVDVDVDYIEIEDVDGLESIKKKPDGNYKLTADISLEGVVWEPIPVFSGTFDGQNHTITDLKFTDTTSERNGGLFDVISGTVKNLTLENATVGAVSDEGQFIEMTDEKKISGYIRVGALAAILDETGEIKNCHVIDSEITGSRAVGALCGITRGNVTGCSAEGCTVSGFYPGANAGTYANKNFNPDSIGGLIGDLQLQNGNVTDCEVKSCHVNSQYRYGSSTGGFAGYISKWGSTKDCKVIECSVDSYTSVMGYRLVGGFAGWYVDGTIESSDSAAYVSGESNVGGFIGQTGNGQHDISLTINTFINDCSATGNVSAQYSAGGFTGGAGNSTFTDCKATGDVTTEGVSGNSSLGQAGGFVGCAISKAGFKRCYATGDVTARKGAGGFIGIAMLAYQHSSAEVRINPFDVQNNGGFSECYASGDVTATDDFANSAAGGFAGQLQDNSIVTDCYATGNVSGYKNIGGFVGSVYDCGAVNCYASGVLNCDRTDYMGGFAGYVSRGDARTVVFTNCVFDKDAAGTDKAIGQKNKNISESYSAVSAEAGWPENNPSVDNITAASANAMADAATFTDLSGTYDYVADFKYYENSYSWDFGNTWQSDGTSPYLKNLGNGQVAQLEIEGSKAIEIGDTATVKLTGYGPGECSVSWSVSDEAASIVKQDQSSVTIKAEKDGIAKVSVLLNGVKKKTVSIVTGDAGEYGMTATFIVPAIVADGDGMTAYCVDPSAVMTIRFSESVDTDSARKAGTVMLTKKALAESEVECSIEFAENNTLMYVKPGSTLDNGTTYILRLSNSVKAESGKALLNASAIEFKTRSFASPEVNVTLEGTEAIVKADYVSNIPHYNNDGDAVSGSDCAAVYIVARGGKGARADFGGDILASQSRMLEISNNGEVESVSASLDLSKASGEVYIDVYTWDESGSYLAAKNVTKKVKI